MANLTITEVEKLSQTLIDGQVVSAPQMPAVAEQKVAIGAGSLPSAVFNKKTRFVRVNCDISCSLAFSLDNNAPTAADGFHRLGPNETGYYGVVPGGMLAVIASST